MRNNIINIEDFNFSFGNLLNITPVGHTRQEGKISFRNLRSGRSLMNSFYDDKKSLKKDFRKAVGTLRRRDLKCL